MAMAVAMADLVFISIPFPRQISARTCDIMRKAESMLT